MPAPIPEYTVKELIHSAIHELSQKYTPALQNYESRFVKVIHENWGKPTGELANILHQYFISLNIVQLQDHQRPENLEFWNKIAIELLQKARGGGTA